MRSFVFAFFVCVTSSLLASAAQASYANAPVGDPAAATSTAGQDTGKQTLTAEVKPEKDPNEVICRKIERPDTGTRLAKRKKECRTRAEWDQIQQDAQEFMKDATKPGAMPDQGPGGD